MIPDVAVPFMATSGVLWYLSAFSKEQQTPNRESSSNLSDRGLRVEHEIAERSLEDPAELCEKPCVVGDGPGGGSSGPVPPLDYPL